MNKIKMAAVLVVICIFSSLVTPIVDAQDMITLSVNDTEIEFTKNVFDLTSIKAQIEYEEIVVENKTNTIVETNNTSRVEDTVSEETIIIESDTGIIEIEEIIVEPNNEETEVSNIIIGDADGNGVIDANDASIVLEAYKNDNQDNLDKNTVDLDKNGVIDANDAALILELYKTI